MLCEISQTEINTIQNYLYVESRKKSNWETECRIMVARSCHGLNGMIDERFKFLDISTMDLMYSMMIISNDTVLYMWYLLGDQVEELSLKKKEGEKEGKKGRRERKENKRVERDKKR